MRFKQRFVFRADIKDKSIVKFLADNNISYETTNGIELNILEIFEDNEAWSEVNELMAQHNIHSMCESLYSKDEYDKAKWLTIRSKWRWEYPQPDDFGYKHLTYDDSNYCDKCGCGLIQQSEFRIKKEPNWNSRNFLMLNWVHDELFINNKAESILKENDLRGFKIYNVNHYKKNQPLENTKQIFVTDIIKPGLINQNNTIRDIIHCGVCGTNKLIEMGRGIIFRKDPFDDIQSDIIKSSEVFGDGLMCARLIIVSKKFYDVVKTNKLDRNLSFEPIIFD